MKRKEGEEEGRSKQKTSNENENVNIFNAFYALNDNNISTLHRKERKLVYFYSAVVSGLSIEKSTYAIRRFEEYH